MSLKVYNVLKRKKEDFIPQEEGKVKMYACGITASGDAHIGHALQACVFDMITKYLVYRGYDVTYVRNYTDVDDKIIAKANELGVDPMSYAQGVMTKIDSELRVLSVDRPTIQSKATECMDDIIRLVQVLVDKGYAYKVDNGDVFFKVISFPRYGAFSNRLLENSKNGVRININQNKKDERDFALWKSVKEGEISWDSPWGKGRPGWHIECSAMSMKYLGDTLDIHGGGKDLIFPHHENEIAQSECATGKQFSRYWLHNGLIKINGQKMSKSFGNGILLQDILSKYNPDVIRLTLHQTHYRSDVNIMDGMFEQYENKVYNLYKTFLDAEKICQDFVPNENSELATQIENSFIKAMDNDFNTALAIADLFQHISLLSKLLKQRKYQDAVDVMHIIKKEYYVLGICQQDPKSVINSFKNKYLRLYSISEEEIQDLIEKRSTFKKEMNYQAADEVKEILVSHGIEVKDTRDGVEWDIIIKHI